MSMNGAVKWYSRRKGYGFILGDDGNDYYFNTTSIIGIDLPRGGDSVRFDGAMGQRGLRASRVCVIASRSSRAGTSSNWVLHWFTNDHFHVQRALETIPGLGFWENLKFVLYKLLLSFLAMIVTGVIIFLLIAYGVPWLLFGGISAE